MRRRPQVQRGSNLRCRGWRQEGLLRLLENVLAVGEDPENLVVYAALGKAARDWPSHDTIVTALRTMDDGETLLVQSGKPVGILKTHPGAPVVLMANCNIVGRWARPEVFYELQGKGLICWGGLTAGDWQYIGSQGVLQGTFEIFMRIGEQRFGGDLSGRFVLTAGLGGMGGAQPLAGRLAGAAILCVEVDEARIARRLGAGMLDEVADGLDDALRRVTAAAREGRALSVGLLGNAAEIFPAIAARGIVPDVVTDQTSAHDLVYGYVPPGLALDEVRALRESDPGRLMALCSAAIADHVRAMLAFRAAGAAVFDNGNLIRTQAKAAGVEDAFAIPIFTEAFLRPLFARGIGPFRWICLSGERSDLARMDALVLELFADDHVVSRWIRLAGEHVPVEGLPARIAWLGHGARTRLAGAANALVRSGELSAPVAFTRDHLDAGAMTHPNIMTENLIDGSDAIADWPLLNAMANVASKADLVAIHSGGGGYAGFMTSAGVTVIADGTAEADERIRLSLTNDTATGVLRYADAGYPEAVAEAERAGISRIAPG